MKNKNFLTGLVLIVLFAVGFYYLRQFDQNSPSLLTESPPVTIEEELAIENRVGIDIPEDVEKIKLSDVLGTALAGIATRGAVEGGVEYAIIADLPGLGSGELYQGWLIKDDEIVPAGNLEERKGGWVLSYISIEGETDYDQVMVTIEKEDDNQPEEKLLEGKF